MAEHKRGESRNHFCGVPGKPCEHPSGPGNNYYTVCAPAWAAMTYAQQFTAPGSSTPGAVRKSYEAHHILCVSQVKKVVVKATENTDLEDIVGDTHWCINDGNNMIAMPMWGHTIMWYCNDFAGVASGDESALFQTLGAQLTRPLFADLPQHNYGHSGADNDTSYNKEIEAALVKVMEGVDEAADEHATKAITALQGGLNNLSSTTRTELRDRGVRVFGGTHPAWLAGLQNNPGWYAPFSMAKTPTPMTFPTSNTGEGMARKLVRLAQAFWKL